MNLWQSFEKENCSLPDQGFSLHFDRGIDENLRTLYLHFSRWLRSRYVFPVHVSVYVLNQEKVRLRNGRLSYGSFRWYPKRSPRIRVPSKPESELLETCPLAEIYVMVLSSFVHELTHYFQWVSALEQTNAVSERQANYYRFRIIEQYFTETNEKERFFPEG